MYTVFLKTPIEFFPRKPMVVFSEKRHGVKVYTQTGGVRIEGGPPKGTIFTPWHNVLAVRWIDD